MKRAIKPLALGLAAVLGGAVTVTVSSAVAAGPTKYAACADKKTLALRYLPSGKRCRSTEKTLSWNAVGPAGAAGLNGTNGTNGAPGVAGTNGYSDVFENETSGDGLTFASTDSANPTALASLTVPRGSYDVSVAALLNNTAANAQTVRCRIGWSGGPSSTTTAGTYTLTDAPVGFFTVDLSHAAAPSGALPGTTGTITLSCYTVTASTVKLYTSSLSKTVITATRIDHINPAS